MYLPSTCGLYNKGTVLRLRSPSDHMASKARFSGAIQNLMLLKSFLVIETNFRVYSSETLCSNVVHHDLWSQYTRANKFLSLNNFGPFLYYNNIIPHSISILYIFLPCSALCYSGSFGICSFMVKLDVHGLSQASNATHSRPMCT